MANMNRVGKTSTTVRTDGPVTRVKYHSTVVVAFEKRESDGHTIVRLNSGGWRTATTKARMNQASNQFGLGFQVYQTNRRWSVSIGGSHAEFEDNMLFDATACRIIWGANDEGARV